MKKTRRQRAADERETLDWKNNRARDQRRKDRAAEMRDTDDPNHELGQGRTGTVRDFERLAGWR